MTDDEYGNETKKLHNAYAAKTVEELAETYDAWAGEYEQHMQSVGYTHPAMVASIASRHMTPGDDPLLDAGCGTGVVSEIMGPLGFSHITGLDASQQMLKAAEEKGRYTSLHHMYLGQPLDFADNAFAHVVAAGVFTQGHAPLSGFDELLRVTRPGGHLVFSIARTYLDGLFDEKRSELEAQGKWTFVDQSGIYNSAPLGDTLPSRVYCFQVS